VKIFIAGVDGYLGWSLAQHLTSRGHEVAGAGRFLFAGVGCTRWDRGATTPIASDARAPAGVPFPLRPELTFWETDLRGLCGGGRIFRDFQPDAVVHLGECPSAPYSMMDVNHSVFVQTNNM